MIVTASIPVHQKHTLLILLTFYSSMPLATKHEIWISEMTENNGQQDNPIRFFGQNRPKKMMKIMAGDLFTPADFRI